MKGRKRKDYIGKIFKSKKHGKFIVEKLLIEKASRDLDVYQVKFINTGSITSAPLDSIRRGKVPDPLYYPKYMLDRITKDRIRDKKKKQLISKHKDKIKEFFKGNEVRNTPVDEVTKVWDKNDSKFSVHGGYRSGNRPSDTNILDRWRNLLRRVHTEPTYAYTRVCDEWYDYDNFYDFVKDPENGYRIGYHLDKDILSGNSKYKLYSPETCIYIPKLLNQVLIDRKYMKEHRLPSGNNTNVCKKGRIVSSIDIGVTKITLGTFLLGDIEDEMSAFCYYKIAKEYLVKLIAEYMYEKKLITQRVYKAVLTYRVYDNRVGKYYYKNKDIVNHIDKISQRDKDFIYRRVDIAFTRFKEKIDLIE